MGLESLTSPVWTVLAVDHQTPDCKDLFLYAHISRQ